LTAPLFFTIISEEFSIFPLSYLDLLSGRYLWKAAPWLALLALTMAANSRPPRPRPQTSRPAPADFKTLAAQAEQANEQDRLDEAVVLYRKALALKPSWPEGWWALGTIHYDRNEFKQAAVAFRRASTLQPHKGSPLIMLGLCEFELSDDNAALKHIEEGKELGFNPDSQFQQVMLYHEGVLLSRKGKFNRAGEIFSELSHQGVQTDDLTFSLGMAALRMLPKDLPAEGTPGREVVRRIGQAEAQVAAKKFDEAKQAYADLISEYPDFPNIHYAHGRALLGLSEVDAAVAAFQQEIKNSPRNIPARLQIAAARYRLDSADGIKYAKEVVELAPQDPFGHYLLGLLYLDTGDFPSSISELEIAKRAYGKAPDLYFALGNAYARAGRKEEAAQARATFRRLSAANKKNTIDLNKAE
jgi:tetratricopeptide (TPR) repeat protein